MISKRRFLLFWIGGLIAFAVAIVLHMPLTLETVPEGIVDHQTAGSAARVDYIHRQWSDAGVYRNAFTAMVSDLGFIVLYSLGSLFGGFYFRRAGHRTLRMIGWALIASAIVFFASDMTETTLQLQQVMAGKGDDAKADLAAAMMYPKLVSWIACFILPLNALIIEWAEHRKR